MKKILLLVIFAIFLFKIFSPKSLWDELDHIVNKCFNNSTFTVESKLESSIVKVFFKDATNHRVDYGKNRMVYTDTECWGYDFKANMITFVDPTSPIINLCNMKKTLEELKINFDISKEETESEILYTLIEKKVQNKIIYAVNKSTGLIAKIHFYTNDKKINEMTFTDWSFEKINDEIFEKPSKAIDGKTIKARQDCETIARSIQIFNERENKKFETLEDLKGKYITNLDILKDPWKNKYDVDIKQKLTFSKGPDGKSTYGFAKNSENTDDDKDNVCVSY